MKRPPISSRPKLARPRASVFIFSLLLVVIAGTSTMTWLSYITETQRAADRDRARTQAFYAAEAGIDEVISYFNDPSLYAATPPLAYTEEMSISPYPEAYTGAPANYAMFEPYIVEVDKDNLGNVMNNDEGNPVIMRQTFLMDLDDLHSSKVPSCALDVENPDLVFYDADGQENARVTSLILLNPRDASAADPFPATEPIITKVISTATTPEGVDVTVEVMLTENEMFNLGALAAIISETAVDWNGRFNVHYGEVWSKEDQVLPNNFNNPNNVVSIARGSEDPWLKVRTERWIRNGEGDNADYGDGREDGAWSSDQIEVGAQNYYIPFLEETLHGNNHSNATEYDHVEQILLALAAQNPISDSNANLANAVAALDWTNGEILLAAKGGKGNGNGNGNGNGGGGNGNGGGGNGNGGGGNGNGGGGGGKGYSDYENIQQQQDLPWPEYDYNKIRDFFLDNNLPYYYSGSDGKIYGVDNNPESDTYGETVGKSYTDWFDVSPGADNYWKPEEQLIFIDTIPTDAQGNKAQPGVIDSTYYPREPNENNMATFSPGSGSHTRGGMFIAGHFSKTGGPPNFNYASITDPADESSQYIVKPDGSDIEMPPGPPFRPYHNGLQVVWGTVSLGGNAAIYGSIYTAMGFQGNGTKRVVYNYRMKDGSWLDLNQSAVNRNLWAIRTAPLPEIAEPEV